MSISRDILQGFIDGYITAGGDPTALDTAISKYLTNHPVYPTKGSDLNQIVSDIPSYRVTPQQVLAPTPVPLSKPVTP